ncbi:hypothetical protein C8A05DRAFT_18914 [Staphylotrichum tortipilum]|uniref:Mediator of RNA polymerase II transcription subunit 18 n=1 Tax=Staphylotrichum tortipilum TaxID=2831512 RepID=A0AAN6MDL1_9PEZI|nr:hypothetical protein C8A05DRAFT_18914 [Staphylotrichum longicolle]
MLYEVFITACLPDDDAETAQAILSGVTEMRHRERFTRVNYYEPQDKGLPTIKQLLKERPPTLPQWQELNLILAKQPSVLQLRTDITEEIQSAQARNATAADVPADKPRVARWTDLPDPPNPRHPFITQRKVLEFADPRAETILADNKFRFKSSLIEESYLWWLNGIEYEMVRMYMVDPDPNPGAPQPGPTPGAPQQVPNPSSLEPVGSIWILYVRARVDPHPPSNMLDRMTQGQTHLAQIRERLLGVFDFKIFDRRCRDTRIQEARIG